MRLYASLAAAMLLAPNLLAQTISLQPTSFSLNISPSTHYPVVEEEIMSSPTDTRAAPGAADGPPAPRQDDPKLPPPDYDWGLVRAYFTVGDLASQERDQFSHQDLFLAFRLDKTYAIGNSDDASGKHSHRPGLNTYFDTRLTALPVAVQACNKATTSCSNTNTSSPGDGTTNPATIDSYLNSQKTARLAFGVYAPILLNRWNVATRTASGTQDQPYALYVAPVIKTGFDTTLNGLNQTQQESTTPATVQAIGSSNHFYKFYDFGFRLGHYGLSKDPGTAHEQLSYLDVSWGRFGNLASLLCPAAQYDVSNDSCKALIDPNTNQPLPLNLAWHRDVRMNVEGLLEIPATHGFSIGFSTNVSYYPGSKKNVDLVHIRPADDLRFLFAYKFDISKIAAKLAPGFGN